MTKISFVGTGDYLAYERYWNGFLVDGRIVVEPSPAVVPHLHRLGVPAASIDVVVISHFHADHTFGWPFLLLDLVRHRGTEPVFVVGPPGLEDRLTQMVELGGVANIQDAARHRLDLRFVEVDGSWQTAGPLRFRGYEVDHVPWLRCFGYAFDRGSMTLGYSGDTQPCPGLDALAAACDALVLECNGAHPGPKVHMDIDDVKALRARFPRLPFVLTHLGLDVIPNDIPHCLVASDLQSIEL